MKDKLNNFISYGVYTFEEITLPNKNTTSNTNNYLKT